MTIEQLIFFITVTFIAIIVGMAIFIFYYFRKDIMSFLKPQNYALITLLEQDNNVRTWLQRKTADLRFNFNEGFYNMFDTVKDSSNKPVPSYKKVETSIYRTGRLSHFFYNENNPSPIDFRNIDSTENPQLIAERTKLDLSQLFREEDNSILALIKDYGIFIVIGLIILLIILSRGT